MLTFCQALAEGFGEPAENVLPLLQSAPVQTLRDGQITGK